MLVRTSRCDDSLLDFHGQRGSWWWNCLGKNNAYLSQDDARPPWGSLIIEMCMYSTLMGALHSDNANGFPSQNWAPIRLDWKSIIRIEGVKLGRRQARNKPVPMRKHPVTCSDDADFFARCAFLRSLPPRRRSCRLLDLGFQTVETATRVASLV